ncbi:MAG: hypothetical protein XD65_0074 [Caldanaerobacter subterraneus]|jgi:hypothetical protein|uniref:hypothetical protein n=1 Tax=Thermoanaerobacter TaxID=1754 RepID=UPI0001A973FC|nr:MULTISPECIES: hypothetical protein [Thermoanaerobacter]KUJ90482.1 MAG: hypothetical protein XD37_1304 [Thermoanaerobacter thermocopriae]KUK35592.1 MAG: hypothetical protein XD65_0074 [Caldanaerobacter subterraneus]MBZ4655588.1 hypothetical protein [Thermoanaerobacter sp.]MDI3478843.1 hypothetical protein [Thermoanaerobacterium sp.]MDI3500857.1 hypothetical protein [Thermoanaerobacter sp.]
MSCRAYFSCCQFCVVKYCNENIEASEKDKNETDLKFKYGNTDYALKITVSGEGTNIWVEGK